MTPRALPRNWIDFFLVLLKSWFGHVGNRRLFCRVWSNYQDHSLGKFHKDPVLEQRKGVRSDLLPAREKHDEKMSFLTDKSSMLKFTLFDLYY